jgi:hypothetical protein
MFFPLGLRACGENGIWLQTNLQSQVPQVGLPDSFIDTALSGLLAVCNGEGSLIHFSTNILNNCHALGTVLIQQWSKH